MLEIKYLCAYICDCFMLFRLIEEYIFELDHESFYTKIGLFTPCAL